MTIYNKKTDTAETLIARETAPAAAHKDMYHGNASLSKHGPLSVAIPGEVAGYWEARRRYGNADISWRRIIQPTIDMCRNGITVSWTLAAALASTMPSVTDPSLLRTFMNPETGKPWVEGDVYYRTDLADTLDMLAEAGDEGDDLFYRGEIARKIVQDLGVEESIITEEDFANYRPVWLPATTTKLDSLGLTVHSIPPPGSGPVMQYILNILDNFSMSPKDERPLLYHRITEAFKWAYALRTEIGDPIGDEDIAEYVHQVVANMTSEDWAWDRYSRINDSFTVNNASYYGAVFYNPEDHGTAHASVLAPNGDAVSVTSTINLYLGSHLMSASTGVILNDEMDDFSSPNITNAFGMPPSPNNFIKPGKRPLSSMDPTIITGQEGVRLILGAAGGTKITSLTALVALRNLWLDKNIKEAIDEFRIHHQLIPMHVSYDSETPQDILDGLSSRGHLLEEYTYSGVACGVARGKDGRIYANADKRKAGGVDGF